MTRLSLAKIALPGLMIAGLTVARPVEGQGTLIEVTTPAEGAEVRPGAKVTVAARITDVDGVSSVGLYWYGTDKTLRCPGGNGNDWTCTRTGDVATWVIDLSDAVGVRRYRLLATDANGNQTITADRTLRVTPQPSAGTVGLLSPAAGTAIPPGTEFVFAARITPAASVVKSARVRISGEPVSYALSSDPTGAGQWRLPALLLPDAAPSERTFTIDVTTENGQAFTGGPYRLVVGSGGGGDAGNGNFPVWRYAHAPALSDGYADSTLARGHTILSVNDGSYDVECPPRPRLLRKGPVQSFSFTDGNIDTPSELEMILGRSGRGAYLVNEINYCGGYAQPGFTIIGCARPGSPVTVVKRQSLQYDAILWMHEYGHVVGLGHLDVSRNVMSPLIGFDHTMVYPSQCDNYQGGGRATLAAGVALPSGADADTVPVLEFIRRVYIEGVPFEAAAQYGAADVPALLAQLEHPGNSVYLPTLVATLGAIGDSRAVRPLMAFAEHGAGALTDEQYGARKGALLAIGHIIALTRGGAEPLLHAGLEYLSDGADPAYWARTLRWTLPYDAPTSTRDWQMAKAAVLALGITGERAAAESLRKSRALAATRGTTPADFGEVVGLAEKANETVARVGLRAFYARRQ